MRVALACCAQLTLRSCSLFGAGVQVAPQGGGGDEHAYGGEGVAIVPGSVGIVVLDGKGWHKNPWLRAFWQRRAPEFCCSIAGVP